MLLQLLTLIILATLTLISAAQSREASILDVLITTTDTIPDSTFTSLVSIIKRDTELSPSDPKTLISPLAFIYRSFLPGDPAEGADASDPAVFLTYLRRCGPMTSPYGWRASSGRMHHGIDVGMAVGDTVRAALSGTVECINYQPHGYGNYVVLSHEGGLETRYAHLKTALVIPGQYVMTGEPIALSGNSGTSTGPHLHFETRRMKIPFNPISDLTLPPDRLPPSPQSPLKPLKSTKATKTTTAPKDP